MPSPEWAQDQQLCGDAQQARSHPAEGGAAPQGQVDEQRYEGQSDDDPQDRQVQVYRYSHFRPFRLRRGLERQDKGFVIEAG